MDLKWLLIIFKEKTECIEAEENLKKRIEFETTISLISSKFVNPVDIDEAINSSLKNIGIISQASRSYLFLFNKDNITMSNTHEWCDEGVKPQLKELQNIPIAPFQWSINKLKNNEILNIENVEDLPPEALVEKEEFLRENIKSLIFLPLKIGEELAGFIGFDNIRAPEKWRKEDLNLLNVSSEIIGNALKRNRTEQELEELNKELQKRVKERTINLKESEEKYRKAYYQANLYRDIFAHDINNILQNISSSVELCSLYLHNPEKMGTIKELYEIVDEQVNRAKKLISNVRKITELDDSEIILEKMDVNLVLKNAIEFLQSSFQTRNIDINLNTPTKRNYVCANNLLLDVFENILINAVRHNNKSKIEVTIDISKEEKGDKKYIKMEFKDNGIGISDYRKKSIFERGTQKIQRSRGMGLGLSLVKKIIDIYHGDIWVEDRILGDYKQGSNFIILIPTNDKI